MRKHLLFIPGPVTVAEPVLAAMATPMIDHRGPEFAALQTRVTRGLQPIFGTTAEVVLLGGSGTSGLEAAVASSFSPGQKVLSCPVGVFGRRLANIAKTFGLEVEVLETPPGSAVDPAALAARLAADPAHEIAGILLTHNETSTGVQNDMAALSRAIGSHPATRIVDSVSGLGASEFRMDEWRYDVVVAASQKALGVPPGIAMVAVSARAWERIAKATAPRFYLDLAKAREFAKQGQTPWTPPLSILFALDVAIERYHAEGAPRVWARHSRYAEAIRAFAKGSGISVFSKPGAHSCTVVALEIPARQDAASIRKALHDDHGITIGGGQAELKGKILRIGTMGDISAADVLDALEALDTVMRARSFESVREAGLRAARESLSDAFAATG
ncbi:MAG: pyridoxal-phosphate-dependent aminotransferase family protein [Vulcanimicrobiaceae bacterium]